MPKMFFDKEVKPDFFNSFSFSLFANQQFKHDLKSRKTYRRLKLQITIQIIFQNKGLEHTYGPMVYRTLGID